MHEKDSVFDSASQELEKSIQEDKQTEATETDLGARILKAVKETTADFMKSQTSDLKAEKDKRGTLTDSKEDPAKSPKKSGKDYPDSTKYEARKAEDEDDEDEDDDDKLSYFKKKKSKKSDKKVKKSEDLEFEDDEDDEAVDATEFVSELKNQVDGLEKSVDKIEEGVAVFGEILTELADPRRDKLLVNLSKAVAYLVEETKTIRKSLDSNDKMMKAIAQLPGMPKVVGVHHTLAKAEETGATDKDGKPVDVLSKSEKDRLFQAAVKRQISTEEMRAAISNNDRSVLERLK